MKKILFVTSALGIGGMERVLVDIANALVDKNFDVTILTYIKNEGDSWIVDLDGRVHFIYKKNREFPVRERLPYVHRYYKRINYCGKLVLLLKNFINTMLATKADMMLKLRFAAVWQ